MLEIVNQAIQLKGGSMNTRNHSDTFNNEEWYLAVFVRYQNDDGHFYVNQKAWA